jgi:c-di-GMP-binding flagellar brake protein YcgR
LESRTSQRFPLELPIQLRSGGAAKSLTTRDVSAGGVYIRAKSGLKVGSKVKFNLTLPANLLGAPKDVRVVCDGHVVRVDTAKPKNGKAKPRVGVACVIDSYKFLRS